MSNETYLILPIIIMAFIGIFNILLIVGNFSANNFNTVSSQSYINSITSSVGNIPIIGWIIAPIYGWFLGIMVQNFTLGVTLGVVGLIGFGIVFALLGLRLSAGTGALTANISGSIGLSDVSVMIIYKSILFLMIWLLFTGISISAINSFPLFLGWILYLMLSGVYAVGVLGQIGHV